MLNTFENAKRSEARRIERERSIRAMQEASSDPLEAFVDESGTDNGAGEGDEDNDLIQFAETGGAQRPPPVDPDDDDTVDSDTDTEIETLWDDPHHQPRTSSPKKEKKRVGGLTAGGSNLYGGSFRSNVQLRAASDNEKRGKGPGLKLLRKIMPTFGPNRERERRLRKDEREQGRGRHHRHNNHHRGHGGYHHHQGKGRNTNLAPAHADGYDIAVSDIPLDHVGRSPYGEDDYYQYHLDRFLYWVKMICDHVCHPRVIAGTLIGVGLTVGILHGVIFSGKGAKTHKGHRPYHGYPNHNLARIEAVAKRIINAGVSTPEELHLPEKDTDPRTPQNKAMEWIALSDPRHLRADSDYLLQRYGLAVFWFATHPHLLLPGSSNLEHSGTEKHAREKKAQHHHEHGGNGNGTSSAVGTAAGAAKKGGAGVHKRGGGHHTGNVDPEWTEAEGWMSDRGICSWHGVRCKARIDPHKAGVSSTEGRKDDSETDKEIVQYNADGEVTALILDDNNVAGELPDEIFTTLTALEILDLNRNGMRGKLYDSVGMLKNVKTLSLNGNSFEGQVPRTVHQLKSVEDLDLSENMFSGTIPGHAIAQLGDTLLELSLYGNDFTGTVPTILGTMEKVQTLYLDSNKLVGTIPSELGGCKSMRDLRLRDNSLTGSIPHDLGRLGKLEVLYLDTNELTDWIPDTLGGLNLLEELDLYDNKLVGPLPPTFSNLKNLQHMYLDGNSGLSGTLPAGWCTGLTKLKHLYLSNNRIHGPIPTEIGGMIELTKLHLGHNHFAGPVHTELGQLKNLTELNLEGNTLDGSIPTQIGGLTNLKEVALQGNKLTGTVPHEMCQLRQDYGLEVLTVRCHAEEMGEVQETQSVVCDMPNCCTEC